MQIILGGLKDDWCIFGNEFYGQNQNHRRGHNGLGWVLHADAFRLHMVRTGGRRTRGVWAMTTKWTLEKTQELRRLWLLGKTAGEIAYVMRLPSRNAVIGKAHRLGLRKRVDAPSPVGSKIKYNLKSKRIKQEKAQRAFGEPKKLENLKNNQCHWPIGTKDFLFCGAESVTGKPYCENHCQIAYIPLRKRGVDKPSVLP